MDQALKDRIDGLLRDHPILLFIKGTKSFPQCGFSASVLEVFKRLDVPVDTVNILADGDLRQGMKEYSDWPTFPQVYVKGEFVGGRDIVVEMFEKGELAPLVKKASA